MHACNALKRITIPSSVRHIRESAFFSCNSLEDVEILGEGSSGSDVADGDIGHRPYQIILDPLHSENALHYKKLASLAQSRRYIKGFLQNVLI